MVLYFSNYFIYYMKLVLRSISYNIFPLIWLNFALPRLQPTALLAVTLSMQLLALQAISCTQSLCTEAVIRDVVQKKVSLKILQKSQENICV